MYLRQIQPPVQAQIRVWLIVYTKRGKTPYTRYLSSLKVIASYHILSILTSRLINLIRILIFRTILSADLYAISLFYIRFGKNSGIPIGQRTVRHVRKPQREILLFLHAVRAFSPAAPQTDSGTFGKRILRQLRIKYHTFFRDHTIRCITGNRQCKLLQKHGKVRQPQQTAYFLFWSLRNLPT